MKRIGKFVVSSNLLNSPEGEVTAIFYGMHILSVLDEPSTHRALYTATGPMFQETDALGRHIPLYLVSIHKNGDSYRASFKRYEPITEESLKDWIAQFN